MRVRPRPQYLCTRCARLAAIYPHIRKLPLLRSRSLYHFVFRSTMPAPNARPICPIARRASFPRPPSSPPSLILISSGPLIEGATRPPASPWPNARPRRAPRSPICLHFRRRGCMREPAKPRGNRATPPAGLAHGRRGLPRDPACHRASLSAGSPPRWCLRMELHWDVHARVGREVLERPKPALPSSSSELIASASSLLHPPRGCTYIYPHSSGVVP
ncbi:hypothetical protein C8Q78DRAFT_376360 [Trametes maxima]|nr:hypothetical protein C8Q78DRAFT_376360 [Trametes maxima]